MVISLVEKVSHSLDTGKIVVGVFLDLEKAFDTIDYKILLDKLYAHGIRNNIYEWFKSYLANRSQYVIHNKSKSEIKILPTVYLKALFWALFCLYFILMIFPGLLIYYFLYYLQTTIVFLLKVSHTQVLSKH